MHDTQQQLRSCAYICITSYLPARLWLQCFICCTLPGRARPSAIKSDAVNKNRPQSTRKSERGKFDVATTCALHARTVLPVAARYWVNICVYVGLFVYMVPLQSVATSPRIVPGPPSACEASKRCRIYVLHSVQRRRRHSL